MMLVDTGALYALIDKNDRNHESAGMLYRKVVGEEVLYISLPIMTEAWLLVASRLGTHFADKLWGAVLEGVFEILAVDEHDLKSAFEIERKYHKAGFGFVDSTCFALCERHKIREVFTYDRKHFGIYKPGFAKSLELLP